MARLIPGVNDIATTHPELAAEWHPTKNDDLTPAQVAYGSTKKVWWQCSEGHEWQADPNHRCKGRGCAICAGKKVLPGYNDIATTHPEFAAEWHPIKNGDLTSAQVTKGSTKKVWWQCSEGHEWQATVNNRTANHRGCPYCVGRVPTPGKNDLATISPELIAEWHPTKNGDLTPDQARAGSTKKVWWLGPCGHEWEDSVIHRRSGRSCPICAAERKTSFPEQAIFFYLNQLVPAKNRYMLNCKTEIDIYLPAYKIGIEYDGEAWHKDIIKDTAKNQLCQKQGVRLIRVREPGCPSMPGECILLKSLAVDELNKAIQELCVILGKTVDVNINRDRTKIYEQYIETKKKNSLIATHPELAAQWHPTKNGYLRPENVTKGTTKSFWWQCSKGHEWTASPNSRTRGADCPYCAGKKVLPGYNDLATTRPELAAEWHPTKNGELTPEQVTAGSHKKVWWQCSEGHEWEARIDPRADGRGCPVCAGRKPKKYNK